MVSSDLVFVNFSGSPKDGDASTSRAVRSHVMKKYRKQREAEKRNQNPSGRVAVPFYRTAHFHEPPKSEERSPILQVSTLEGITPVSVLSPKVSEESQSYDDVEDIERREPLPEFQRDTFGDLPLAFLDNNLNPYNFLPISVSPRILNLLQHSLDISSTIRTSVHADPTGAYSSYYVDNAARLYMVLSYSATRFQHRTDNNSIESVYYLTKSISAVNDDLASPSKQASDSTIATVASLANIENLNGNTENAIIHLNGLKQMVDMRGGLDSLGMRGILKRVVLWADLCGATRLQITPRIPLVEFPGMPPISQFLRAETSTSHTLLITGNLLEAAISQSQLNCIRILQDLHELSAFLNDMGKHREDLPPEACYPDRVYSVEHNVLTSITQLNNTQNRSNVFAVLLHASLLFIYTNLRQTPVGGQIRRSLSDRLRSCIQEADLAFLQMIFPAEILWASCLGMVGGKETIDFNWYLSSVEGVCTRKGISTWEGAIEFCIGLPVLETSCRSTCEELWTRDIFL